METTLHLVHHGRNIRRLREILNVKQETIASELNISQQSMSKLEQKSTIEKETLEKIAEIMKIPVEAIKNFNEAGVINIISSSLHDNSGVVMYNPVFNPMGKVFELYDKIIKSKDEEIVFLRGLLERK